MTTLTLTIGGSNFLPQYVTGSARITAQIQNQGDTCEMKIVQKSSQTAPSVGKELVFKDGSRFLFGGFITKVTPVEFGVGQLIEYQVEATDYTYILINKYAQSSYAGQTLGAIVADLMTNYIDSGYAMTHTNTATGPTVTTVNFNHISLRQCFENLAKLTGYIWWVDYSKDVHFVDPSSPTAAPEQITDALKNHESIAITIDVSQVRNDIVVLGGTQESNSYPQVILGDANAREWVLVYTVSTMVSIELDTGGGYVSKAFGIDPKDDETGNDFMYSPSRGSIRCTVTTITPSATTKIRVTFKYPLPVVTEVSNPASILAMKALEGGDGKHGYTINDATIVSSDQARSVALQELNQFGNPVLSGEVITRTGLLTAGSYFSPGQLLTVNLPAWGILVDTQYIIQKVVTTLNESGSAIEYHYDITFGGRLLGVVDFLLALATPEDALDNSGEIEKIHAISDTVTIAEVITKNNNVRSVVESVSIAESLSKTNVTPPFKWGVNGTANKGVWNKSEFA